MNAIKHTLALAVLATALSGTAIVTEAHAQSCLTPDQAAAQLNIQTKAHGYIDTRNYVYSENRMRARAQGVKADGKWYGFTYSFCSGKISREVPYAQRPF